MIEIHNVAHSETVPIAFTSSSIESTEPSFCVSNLEKVDNVSIDLDLMRCIEDLNQLSRANNCDRMTPDDSLHKLNVNYAHIMTALEMTMKSMEAAIDSSGKNTKKKDCFAELNIDFEQWKNQIKFLWNGYRSTFPEEHVHVWSSLEHGLSDYLGHLKKRQQLHLECDGLRRQNAQLKYMLQELL